MRRRGGLLTLLAGAGLTAWTAVRYAPLDREIAAVFTGDDRPGFVLLFAFGLALCLLGILGLVVRGRPRA